MLGHCVWMRYHYALCPLGIHDRVRDYLAYALLAYVLKAQ